MNNRVNNLSFPTQTKDFTIALSVAVGTTSFLSIIGSFTIIVSYIFFKELRTASRFLLLNLSVADLIVGIANLVGAASSGDRLTTNQTDQTVPEATTLCEVEAFFGLFGTDASIMWTVALLAYLYITLACIRPSVLWNRIIAVICMILCWTIPLIVSLVFVFKGYFGYEAGFSPGFCTLVIRSNSSNDWSQIYIPIVGYEMFLWPSFMILPILCIIFICHSKCKMRRSLADNNYQYLQEYIDAIRKAENKLIFVPIVFIFIRMWGVVADITTFYLSEDTRIHYRQTTISAFFVFMAGIGDSAQGFVNGIFFCLLTPAVRYRLCLGCSKVCRCCHCYRLNDKYSKLMASLSDVTSSTSTATGNRSNSISSFSSRNYGIQSSKEQSMTNVSSDGFYTGSTREED